MFTVQWDERRRRPVQMGDIYGIVDILYSVEGYPGCSIQRYLEVSRNNV
jgi:hypothetical protein